MFLSQGYGVLLLSLMHGLPSSITSLSINWYQSDFALARGSGAENSAQQQTRKRSFLPRPTSDFRNFRVVLGVFKRSGASGNVRFM